LITGPGELGERPHPSRRTPQVPCRARSSVRYAQGRSWPGRRWDDLRLVGLKLIFLIASRAVSLRRPHQRIRAGRVEAQVDTSGRVVEPHRPENNTLQGMTPPGQPSPAHRAAQAALFQHPLDAARVVAYREHRCSFAPARGPPRGFAKDHGEGRSRTDTLTVSSRITPRHATRTRAKPARSPPTTPASPYTLTVNVAEQTW